MPTCVASGCANISSKTSDDNLTFHRFPFHSPLLLAKWVNAVGRSDWSPTKQSCLCSEHFTPRDFQRSDSGSLKETAVPSKFKRLLTTRPRKTEKLNKKDVSVDDEDNYNTKSLHVRKSINVLVKNNQETKKGNKYERQSSPVKRKRQDSPEGQEVSPPAKLMKGLQGQKTDKSKQNETESGGNQSVTKFARSQSVAKSAGNSVTKTEGNQSAAKSEEIQSKTGKSQLVTNKTKRPPRPRKIMKMSSEESDDDAEASFMGGKVETTDAQVQISADEVLAAVRVELDENELSDDEQPEEVFEKWMKNRMKRDDVTDVNSSVVTTGLPSSGLNEKNEKQATIDARRSKPSCSIPADMDHVVAVNERRTRYRYIYRVGQCFPEEDDDVPFIRSKLTFVIKALQSQNEKMRALQKKCRELSRSNATLRDVLGIPSTDASEELMEPEEEEQLQQQAYLIIGSQPSSSTSLPSYRFTLTDCSPTAISQSTVK